MTLRPLRNVSKAGPRVRDDAPLAPHTPLNSVSPRSRDRPPKLETNCSRPLPRRRALAGGWATACRHARAVAQGWSMFVMTELEAPAIESYRWRDANREASAKAAARYADSVAVWPGHHASHSNRRWRIAHALVVSKTNATGTDTAGFVIVDRTSFTPRDIPMSAP